MRIPVVVVVAGAAGKTRAQLEENGTAFSGAVFFTSEEIRKLSPIIENRGRSSVEHPVENLKGSRDGSKPTSLLP